MLLEPGSSSSLDCGSNKEASSVGPLRSTAHIPESGSAGVVSVGCHVCPIPPVYRSGFQFRHHRRATVSRATVSRVRIMTDDVIKREHASQKRERQSPLPMSITIGYWNIRGLAAPLRMLASYAGTLPPSI